MECLQYKKKTAPYNKALQLQQKLKVERNGNNENNENSNIYDQLFHSNTGDIKAITDAQNFERKWTVNLITHFHARNNFYLLMEYIPGGDMMTLLQKYDTFTENQTRFYIAELVVAIHSIHTQFKFPLGYLKPSNIIRDKEGHIKISLGDFGCMTGFYYNRDFDASKIENSLEDERQGALESTYLWRSMRRSMNSELGIHPYVAPEILEKQQEGFSADWWTVGILIFEFLVGHPPFIGVTVKDVYHQIVNWKAFLKFPRITRISVYAQDLISHLLCEPDTRFAVDDIKGHRFFEGIEWHRVGEGAVPIVPHIVGDEDTSNFEHFDYDESDPVISKQASDRWYMSNYFYE